MSEEKEGRMKAQSMSERKLEDVEKILLLRSGGTDGNQMALGHIMDLGIWS